MSKRGNRRHQPSRTSQVAKDNDGGNKTSPPIPAPVAPHAGESISNSDEQGSSRPSPDALVAEYTKSLRDWTKGLVFVSLITVCVLFLQYCTFEKTDHTLRDTLKANQASQLPFVTLRELKIEAGDRMRYRDPSEKYWSFRPVFENSGSTITKNLQIFPGYVLNSAPGDITLDQLQILSIGNTSPVPHTAVDPQSLKDGTSFKNRNLVLGPHSIQVVGGIALPVEFLKRPNNPWFVYGIATYDDIFQQGPHVTKYCYEVFGLVGAEETPSVAACSHWNCADEECERDKKAFDSETRVPPITVTQPNKK